MKVVLPLVPEPTTIAEKEDLAKSQPLQWSHRCQLNQGLLAIKVSLGTSTSPRELIEWL